MFLRKLKLVLLLLIVLTMFGAALGSVGYEKLIAGPSSLAISADKSNQAPPPQQDVHALTLRSTFQGHTDWVHLVAFSPDGRMLVSTSRDRTIRLWEVSSGKERTIFKDQETFGSRVVFSPDGRILAANKGKCVKLWDVATGKNTRTLAEQDSTVTSFAISADGKTLATGNEDKVIKLWDFATGKDFAAVEINGRQAVLTDLFVGHKATISYLTFTPDGKTLVSGSSDKTIKSWDVVSGKNTATVVLGAEVQALLSMAISKSGNSIVSACRELNLWDVATLKNTAHVEVHSSIKNKLGAKPYINSVAFSPDGKTLIGGCATFKEDNTAINKGEIMLWDVASGKKTASILLEKSINNVLTTVAISPDGKLLASGGSDPTIMLWDMPGGKAAAK